MFDKTKLLMIIIGSFFALSIQVGHTEEKSIFDQTLLGGKETKKDNKLMGALPQLKQNWITHQRNTNVALSMPNTFLKVEKDFILVEAVAEKDGKQLVAELQKLGMKNTAVYGRVVSGQFPISQLNSISSLKELRFIRPSYPMIKAGSVANQADVAMKSDLAKNTYGVDGSGITIGVMSDSYDCLSGATAGINSGDLPNNIIVLDDYLESGCSDEGRAMLELIHDIAPGANLVFRTAFKGPADFAKGIQDLVTAGANIIVDDVGYFTVPFFQDGIIAQSANRAVAAGVAYFSSAGNNGRNSYESRFRSSSTAVVNEGADAHNFDWGNEVNLYQKVAIPNGGTAKIALEWDQPFASISGTGSANDVDIYLLNSAKSEILAKSEDNNLNKDPVEFLFFKNNTNSNMFYLVIEKNSGSTPGRIKYILNGDTVIKEYKTNSSTIIGHPKASSVVAVGAAYYQKTPAFGVTPPIVEIFSSAGGTTTLFDTSGNSVNITRKKPNIVAPDGTNTTFFGEDSDNDGLPNFYGTSAAAPHAAAVAALMLEKESSLTPASITSRMQSTAIDMDIAGHDSNTGYGLLDALAAIPSSSSLPSISSPAAGSILAGSTQTFSWSENGASVNNWWLYIGSSAGKADLYNSGSLGRATSKNVTGLPTDGSTVYTRLNYKEAGAWKHVDSSYTAANGSASLPSITSPAVGSTLTGSTQTFSWSANGASVNNWWLYIGSSAGNADLYNSGSLGRATSKSVTGLPTDGRTVYTTLWYKQAGVAWKSVYSSYTAANSSVGLPSISSPAAGSTLAGSTQTFSWSANGATVNNWWLYIGSSAGEADLYNSGSLGRATSLNISGLPIDGSTIYIRLWYKQAGTWEYVDSSYKAANL